MFFRRKKNPYPSLWIKYPNLYPEVISTFRKVKNEIMRYNKNKILFFLTGTNRQVGVSTMALNLALICGWDISDSRILLIDANIANPIIHKSLSIEKSFGLTDFLYGKTKISDILYKTEMKNLDIIPIGVGCENMSSPFARASFSDFIENVKNIYNIVFVDTAPVLFSEYTQSIISYADGVMVISEAKKTKLEDIKKVYMQIKKYNVDYIGNFLNKKKIVFSDRLF